MTYQETYHYLTYNEEEQQLNNCQRQSSANGSVVYGDEEYNEIDNDDDNQNTNQNESVPILEAQLVSETSEYQLRRRIEELERGQRSAPPQQQQDPTESTEAAIVQAVVVQEANDRENKPVIAARAEPSNPSYVPIMLCAIICLLVAMIVVITALLTSGNNGNANAPSTISLTSVAPSLPTATSSTLKPTISPPTLYMPSPSPTQESMLTLIQRLETLYGNNPTASRDLRTPGTKEYRAVELINSGDFSLIELPSDLMHRYVIALFMLMSEWETPDGWFLPNEALCDWQNDESVAVACNGLAELEHFSLNDQFMFGSIPTEIGWLTQLTHLSIENNPIASQLGMDFRHLKMKDNQRKNDVVPFEHQKNNIARELFVLDDIEIIPFPSEIGQLTKLEFLSFLEISIMGGNLPNEIGNLMNLEYLNLEFNFFSGKLPEELYNLLSLKQLSIGYNLFTGTISTNLHFLTELRSISLGVNSFEGNLPALTDPPFQFLGLIDISYNSFTGFAGDYLGGSSTVEVFLAGNQFFGVLDDYVCSRARDSEYFVSADCLEEDLGGGELGDPQVTCSCCGLCCDSNNWCCEPSDDDKFCYAFVSFWGTQNL